MRLKDFIKSLKDYEWTIKKGGIRSDTGDKQVNCCPLTVKTQETEDMWGECADKLGIPEHVALQITRAADDSIELITNYDSCMLTSDKSNLIGLRKILFRELGLKKELL